MEFGEGDVLIHKTNVENEVEMENRFRFIVQDGTPVARLFIFGGRPGLGDWLLRLLTHPGCKIRELGFREFEDNEIAPLIDAIGRGETKVRKLRYVHYYKYPNVNPVCDMISSPDSTVRQLKLDNFSWPYHNMIWHAANTPTCLLESISVWDDLERYVEYNQRRRLIGSLSALVVWSRNFRSGINATTHILPLDMVREVSKFL